MATDIDIVDRRDKELQVLSSKGFASMTELVQLLSVSESTVRRDLETLEGQGVVRRTHGGAVLIKDSAGHRMAFNERQTTATAQKQAIAQAVAAMIPLNQTVLLDGGTTCYQVAKAIRGKRLNVITNSVPIASLLATDLEPEVTLIGGYVYPRTGVTLGATAQRMLADVHASQLVLSCAAIGPEGAFNANQMMVDVERAMMQAADQVILAVDSSKLGTRAVVRLCDLNELDAIVTDAQASDQARQWLAKLSIKVLYAELASE